MDRQDSPTSNPQTPDPAGTDKPAGAGPTAATASRGADAEGVDPGPDGGGRSDQRGRDRTTRQAALLATLVALPVTVLVAGFAFARLSPDEPAARPSPSATAAQTQSDTPVALDAPRLAERPATVCRALLSQLPTSLRELAQRPVAAGPEQNAAYGDPALTVACGVPEVTFPPTDEVWLVNRVCWYADEQAGATVLSTVDREVAVRVTVPRAYEQPLQWVAPISDVLVATVPSGGDVPPGCQG